MLPLDLTNAVILDTETTGLDSVAEIVEIAIVDAVTDEIVLNTLVRPARPIPPEASQIHGITNEAVRKAPTWEIVQGFVYSKIRDRRVVIYNADYDLRLMRQSAAAWGMDVPHANAWARCAMLWYADYYGDWNDYHGNNRWQKLDAACRQQGIVTNGLHRALSDVLATLALVRAVNAKLQQAVGEGGAA